MIPLFLTTVISCSDAVKIINRVSSIVGLNAKQRIEIITEIRKVIPTCPVTIKNDGPQ
jgi:hypothetical protein